MEWNILLNTLDEQDSLRKAKNIKFALPNKLLIDETSFPDSAFRAFVKTLPGGKDNVFTGEELKAITEINCSGQGISSLQGISCFTELTALNCSHNNLSDLSLPQKGKLQTLDCSYNHLAALGFNQQYFNLTSLNTEGNIFTVHDRTFPQSAVPNFDYYSIDLSDRANLNFDDDSKLISLAEGVESVTYKYSVPQKFGSRSFTIQIDHSVFDTELEEHAIVPSGGEVLVSASFHVNNPVSIQQPVSVIAASYGPDGQFLGTETRSETLAPGSNTIHCESTRLPAAPQGDSTVQLFVVGTQNGMEPLAQKMNLSESK